MSDIADNSFNEEQAYIEENRRNVKTKKYAKLNPVGYCHFCFENLDDKKLFCNDKCATIYDLTSKLKH